MQIKFSSAIGNTPARVNRMTGEILLNADTWSDYTPYEQRLILLHEQGHFLLKTTNEQEADAYALKNYLLTEIESLKKALSSFYNTLDMRNPAHVARYNQAAKIIVETDYELGNHKLIKILKQMYDNELKQLITGYITKKGYSSIAELQAQPQATRDKLMTEFYALPEVVALIASQLKAESSYSEFAGIGAAFSGGINAIKTLIKSPAADKIITWAKDNIGEVFKGDKDIAQNSAAQTAQVAGQMLIGGNANTQTPQQDNSAQIAQMQAQAAAQAEIERAKAEVAAKAEEARLKAEGEKKIAAEKKKKTTMFIGIGAAIVVIAVVLIVVLKK